MSDQKPPFEDTQPVQPAPSNKPAFDDTTPVVQTDYNSGEQQLKTLAEQGLAGLTGGLSKVVETHGIPALGLSPLATPQAIQAREQANPGTAFIGNTLGTGALIAGTGGLGALAPEAGIAGRLALQGIEGAGIGGINQATDDWSQNKALDAQKIAASAGLGTVLGVAGGAIGEGISARAKANAIAKAPSAVRGAAEDASNTLAEASATPVSDIPSEGKTGVQPSSMQELQDKIKAAKDNGTAVELPQGVELDDALSRQGLDNPVTAIQRDSLRSQEGRNAYKSERDAPGVNGETLTNYEAAQKGELVNKTDQAIRDIAPDKELTPDAFKSGEIANDYFTQNYEQEKQALAPFFESLKDIKLNEDALPSVIDKITTAVPELGPMFKMEGGELTGFHPPEAAPGVDQVTYNAVKDLIKKVDANPDSFQAIWDARGGLDEFLSGVTKGRAQYQIPAIKNAMMELMENASDNPEIRANFRRYAVNESKASTVEKIFKGSVGREAPSVYSKVKPEYIGDNIFRDSSTVAAAKEVLKPDQFNHLLGNWLSQQKASKNVTDLNLFKSNGWDRVLKGNQHALNIAFDNNNPHLLQKLKDYTTIMRILPDSGLLNPSNTSNAFVRAIKGHGTSFHNLTFHGVLAEVGKNISNLLKERSQYIDLNTRLSGEALKRAQSSSLQSQANATSDRISKGVKTLFSSMASQARKAQ